MAFLKQRRLLDGSERYTVVWRDRTRRQRERTFRSLIAAQKHLGNVADKDEVAPGNKQKSKALFRDVAERWLEVSEARESSRLRYRQLLDVHVLPVLGGYPIASVSAEDIEHWIAGMKRKRHGKKNQQLRPATIERAFGVVRAVLRYARRHGYVTSVASDGVARPTAASMGTTEFEGRHLTVAEVDAVCEVMYNDSYGILLVRFLAYTGLRAGEVAGLNMVDVDLKAKTVTVRRTWSRGKLTEPKSKASRRVVPLDPELVPLLREYVASHPDSGNPGAPFFLSRVGHGMYTTDLIWPGRERNFAHGSQPIKPRPFQPDKRWDASAFYKNSFQRACGMAGVGHARLHDLRHTFASEQLRAGASLFDVAKLMGHADHTLVARTYGHLAQDAAERAIARTAQSRAAARAAR